MTGRCASAGGRMLADVRISRSALRIFAHTLLLAVGVLIATSAHGQVFGCNQPTANAIVCENSKLGNPPSDWDLAGSDSQTGDTTIEGFATEISVNQGQTVHFRVHTTATAYRIDIYRIGYYG